MAYCPLPAFDFRIVAPRSAIWRTRNHLNVGLPSTKGEGKQVKRVSFKRRTRKMGWPKRKKGHPKNFLGNPLYMRNEMWYHMQCWSPRRVETPPKSRGKRTWIFDNWIYDDPQRWGCDKVKTERRLVRVSPGRNNASPGSKAYAFTMISTTRCSKNRFLQRSFKPWDASSSLVTVTKPKKVWKPPLHETPNVIYYGCCLWKRQ